MFARISRNPSALIYIKNLIGAAKVQLFSIPTKKKHMVFPSIYKKYTNFAS